jgi:hypothetical protein
VGHDEGEIGMRVGVYESRRDDSGSGFDDTRGSSVVKPADRCDNRPGDADIPHPRSASSTVNDTAFSD